MQSKARQSKKKKDKKKKIKKKKCVYNQTYIFISKI